MKQNRETLKNLDLSKSLLKSPPMIILLSGKRVPQ